GPWNPSRHYVFVPQGETHCQAPNWESAARGAGWTKREGRREWEGCHERTADRSTASSASGGRRVANIPVAPRPTRRMGRRLCTWLCVYKQRRKGEGSRSRVRRARLDLRGVRLS